MAKSLLFFFSKMHFFNKIFLILCKLLQFFVDFLKKTVNIFLVITILCVFECVLEHYSTTRVYIFNISTNALWISKLHKSLTRFNDQSNFVVYREVACALEIVYKTALSTSAFV